MIDINQIPNIEKAELMRIIANQVREHFQEEENQEKFKTWKQEKD